MGLILASWARSKGLHEHSHGTVLALVVSSKHCVLKPRSFDLVAVTREQGGRGRSRAWLVLLHSKDRYQSSASLMDMRSGSLLKKGKKRGEKRKKKEVLQCSISPARSCRVVVCCLGTFMIKEFFSVSFFCYHKVMPSNKTNNMQTLKLRYKGNSQDYAFD